MKGGDICHGHRVNKWSTLVLEDKISILELCRLGYTSLKAPSSHRDGKNVLQLPPPY